MKKTRKDDWSIPTILGWTADLFLLAPRAIINFFRNVN